MRTSVSIFFLILNFTGYHAAAQDRHTDSLLEILHTSEHDSTRAHTLWMLSDLWADRDSAKAVDFAKRSFQYTEDKSLLRGLAHFYLAGAYYSYDRLKSQQEYMAADTLLARFTETGALQYRSRAWHNYGALEQQMDNSSAFVNILLTKAIPLAQAAGDGERVAWNYMDIGAVFMNYKDYVKAGQYYQKAIAILHNKQYNNRPVLAECYIHQAKAYVLQGRPDAADAPLQESFRILTSAGDSSYLPVYYLVRGMSHTRMHQWEEAQAALNTGLSIARKQRLAYDAISLQYELYEVYKHQHRFDKAKLALEEVYNGYREYPIAQNGRTILYELAQTEAALGNHPAAFSRLMEYTQLSDSFFTQKTGKEIADLETKYRIAENERKLLRLQNRSQLQQLLLYFGGVVVAFLAAFFIYVYRQRKKREAQRLYTMRQEQEIQITRAQLEGEERERRRLARDLHDGLGGMLAGVKLNLSAASHHKNERQQQDLEKVIGQLDDSVHELRRIARNMMPEALLRSGLTRALEDLCRSMDNQHMRIDYELLNLPENMPQQEKVDIYRIVQELLANAVRHSGATDIFLQCSGRGERFYITIEDNGKGMPDPGRHNEEGLGLTNVRSRVSYLQGKMELDSRPGNGTIINIEINVTGDKAL
ncbi:tetratricopeptide repeat-containing sensor histidine kinase [Chitinophaga alhagiae]|uniref:tetratricopeptide repeat-containing sensor histidine kinase n=1 Tax=Chitinophaga alhagiae TaxID=2203219 RepID=UPI0018E53065|nr:tetratricopeptide repeat-containing sensor histidine kinase [Chitinophaga alhagiae]